MVARDAEGRPVVQIAAELGVSSRTVFKRLRRFREGGRAGLGNRPSAPIQPESAHPDHWGGVAEHLRREYRLTGAEIADRPHLARSTVARWLQQAGIGRLKQLEPWPAAGSVDTVLSPHRPFFERHRAEIAELRMTPPQVVEALDAVEHVGAGGIAGPIDLAADPLGLPR